MSKHHADRSFRQGSSGFTLFEVVVALAIVGLGLGALVAAVGTGLGNGATADRYIEATRRAQSRLAEVGTAIPLQAGDLFGDDGGGYAWRVRISPAAVHAAVKDDGAPLTLYSIAVTISWRSALATRNVTLQSQRTAAPVQNDG